MTAKRHRVLLLSNTRPPLLKKATTPTLSSKATRNLIRTHHKLLKEREKALKCNDQSLLRSVEAQIDANGGLKSYQLASKTGQSMQRGGDTSHILVDWVRGYLGGLDKLSSNLRVLEIGALSTQNACSKEHYLDVTRIDLNSPEPGIRQQDFMKRPHPKNDEERFHVISLSLVLNYVPTAAERGNMLRRCVFFLTRPLASDAQFNVFLPCLFLVLPAPCIKNSRYLNEQLFKEIMASLGFTLLRDKVTAKLVYQLWRMTGTDKNLNQSFSKRGLNPGKARNNFAITLER